MSRWRFSCRICAAAIALATVLYPLHRGDELMGIQHFRIDKVTNNTSTYQDDDSRDEKIQDENHKSDAETSGPGWDSNHNQNNTNSTSSPHWPFLKHMMCRDQTPNPNAWQVLFEMARTELGFPKDRVAAKPPDLIAYDSFFKFNAGGLGYASSERDFVYLRVLKAGNDQIRYNLRATFEEWGGHSEEWKAISDVFRSGVFRNAGCVVTAVRDPIQHFLSGYSEIEHRRFTREDRMGNVGDDQYDSSNVSLPSFARHENGTVGRFEQFVTDLFSRPREAGLFNQYKFWGIQEIAHVFSMTGILWGLKRLRDCHGGDGAPNLTAYLPSLTGLDAELPKLVNEECRLPYSLDPFREAVVHESQLDEYGFYTAAKRAWRDQGNVARALCAVHGLDYACFDTIPVPALCQDVYSRPDFHHKLLRAITAGKQKGLGQCGRGTFP